LDGCRDQQRSIDLADGRNPLAGNGLWPSEEHGRFSFFGRDDHGKPGKQGVLSVSTPGISLAIGTGVED
jgi:hypothetical protein